MNEIDLENYWYLREELEEIEFDMELGRPVDEEWLMQLKAEIEASPVG